MEASDDPGLFVTIAAIGAMLLIAVVVIVSLGAAQ